MNKSLNEEDNRLKNVSAITQRHIFSYSYIFAFLNYVQN